MNKEEIVARATSRGVRVILECIQGGLGDYENPAYYTPAAKLDHTSSVAAACRNCHILARAKRAAVELPDLIKIRKSRGRITFVFADHTEVWFKKIDAQGWPRFRPSQQVMEFTEYQTATTQPTLNVAMPPEKQKWVAGYRPSTAGDTEHEIIITGPEANGKRWEVPLTGAEVRDIFPIPAALPTAATELIKQRVRIRRNVKAKDATGEANS